ncbi:MAG: hypothetical protein HY553_10405, partial [Elusimicrobia bacterium]|nr:hypothetical protein [Elusimicrobiota bacterium]
LERLLKAGQDERALEALIEAAGDAQPDVRRRALAALEGWRGLPANARDGWRERLAAAAAKAAADKDTRVREAGEGLKGALSRGGRAPSEPLSGAPPGRSGRRRAAFAAAVWAICAQLGVLAWARLIGSVLRQTENGVSGLAKLEAGVSRMDFLVFPCVSVALLVCLTGVGGGLALVGALAPAAKAVPVRVWLAGAVAMYGACGLAAFVPAACLARRVARGDAAAGAVRSLWRALRDLPDALALGVLVLLSAPAEPLRGLRAAAATAAGGARRRAWPAAADRAVDAADPLARPFTSGPLLAAYLAAPAVLTAAALPPQLVGAPPIGLFELFFVSDAGFAWIFGVWAGAMAVAGFFGLWFSAAAMLAGSEARRA